MSTHLIEAFTYSGGEILRVFPLSCSLDSQQGSVQGHQTLCLTLVTCGAEVQHLVGSCKQKASGDLVPALCMCDAGAE